MNRVKEVQLSRRRASTLTSLCHPWCHADEGALTLPPPLLSTPPASAGVALGAESLVPMAAHDIVALRSAGAGDPAHALGLLCVVIPPPGLACLADLICNRVVVRLA